MRAPRFCDRTTVRRGPQQPDRLIVRDLLSQQYSRRAAITTPRPIFRGVGRPLVATEIGQRRDPEDRGLRAALVMRARMVREAQNA